MPAALLVIDVQQGFSDEAYWGPRNNPHAEDNMRRLLAVWRARGAPVVLVRHDSTSPGSPLRPGLPGNQLQPWVQGDHALLVAKSVNSAFYGTPDLHQWLQAERIGDLVLCGATTNHCCETSARMAGNLGYRVRFVLDATFTHDRAGPDERVISADELTKATAASLHGEFAEVCFTADVLGSESAT